MKNFNWRAFTSLYILFSFLIIILSGIILYIAPPGRIAKWTTVPLLGLEKDQWQAIHTIFTFIFIIVSGFHLYFNWKIFLSHLRNKLSRKYLRRKEFIWSVIVTILVLFVILFELPPVTTVMAFGESVTDSWEKKYNNPPVPHTEEMTLREIAKLANQNPDSIVQKLKSQNVEITNADAKLKDIAHENEYSPQQLFDLTKSNESINQNSKRQNPQVISNRKPLGRGWGRKTISQICQEENVEVSIAIRNLKLRGIKADADSRIKELTRKYNLRASEIVDIIKS